MVNKPDHKAGYFLVWVGWSGWGRWTRNDDFSGEFFFLQTFPFHGLSMKHTALFLRTGEGASRTFAGPR